MSSLNQVQIIGNVGKDPEIRTMNGGGRVVNLSIATSESWRDKRTGEKKEQTEWHRVVIFNDNLAEIVEKYVSKGDKVYLQGQLQTRKWTDQSGAERYSTEIVLKAFDAKLVLLSPKGGRSGGGDRREDTGPGARPQGGRPEMDDEIPF